MMWGRIRPTSSFVAALGILAGSAAILLVLARPGGAGALSGTIAGGGYSLNGDVAGTPYAHNEVGLPPGGNENIPVSEAQGPLTITSDTAEVDCDGASTGVTVWATCWSQVENLSITAGGVEIVAATLLRSQSNSVDAGSGASSDDTGTMIVGLCVRSSLLGACNAVRARRRSASISRAS